MTVALKQIIVFAADRQMLLRASMGEALVANAITSYFTRPHVLLNNVTLPTDSGTTQSDHVLVADMASFPFQRCGWWIRPATCAARWGQSVSLLIVKRSR